MGADPGRRFCRHKVLQNRRGLTARQSKRKGARQAGKLPRFLWLRQHSVLHMRACLSLFLVTLLPQHRHCSRRPALCSAGMLVPAAPVLVMSCTIRAASVLVTRHSRTLQQKASHVCRSRRPVSGSSTVGDWPGGCTPQPASSVRTSRPACLQVEATQLLQLASWRE